jgi:hypothetical protein
MTERVVMLGQERNNDVTVFIGSTHRIAKITLTQEEALQLSYRLQSFVRSQQLPSVQTIIRKET